MWVDHFRVIPSLILLVLTFVPHLGRERHCKGSRDGAVVRALASHQCCSGLILARCHMWVEFAVGSRLASRGFLRVLRFSCLHKTQHLQIPIRSVEGRGRERIGIWRCWSENNWYATRAVSATSESTCDIGLTRLPMLITSILKSLVILQSDWLSAVQFIHQSHYFCHY